MGIYYKNLNGYCDMGIYYIKYSIAHYSQLPYYFVLKNKTQNTCNLWPNIVFIYIWVVHSITGLVGPNYTCPPLPKWLRGAPGTCAKCPPLDPLLRRYAGGGTRGLGWIN